MDCQQQKPLSMANTGFAPAGVQSEGKVPYGSEMIR